MNQVLFKGVLDGIFIDRIARDNDFSMPTMHFHPEFEIYYLLEGARYYFIGNKTYQINKGSLILIDSMQIHRTSMYGKEAHDRILIEIASEPFSGFFENICAMPLEVFFAEHAGILELTEGAQKYVESLLFEITREFEKHQPHYQSLVMMKIAEILIFVKRCKSDKCAFSKTSMSNAVKHKRIHDITEFIMENYDKVKSLDEISKHFFLNKSYLCRIFKEVTGFTVQDYINIHCIKKAQELLENSSMSVSEIAASLGYGSVTYFERIFKKYTETTPFKYRKKIHMIRRKVRERKIEKELKP